MSIYITPSSDILPLVPSGTGAAAIYKGESLAGVLSSWGLFCTFVARDVAPQVLTYHFTLLDVLQRARVRRFLPALSALLHTDVTDHPSQKGHFALMMARPTRATVYFRDALLDERGGRDRPLSACLGYDTANNPITVDITKAPHILIAGATGSGKSVCLNTIINSLLFKATPNKMRLLMVDTKRVELSAYEGIPHLYAPIAKDGKTALAVVAEVVRIMRERAEMMERGGYVDISQTNYPRILLVIDELADLMLMCKEEVEPLLVTIAQLGRAAGIHLIVATQRPTVNVVTGLLKANIPCRIALQTASLRDSMTILDHKGAEALTGNGDALLKTPDKVKETRLQVSYISRTDINAVVGWWKNSGVVA